MEKHLEKNPAQRKGADQENPGKEAGQSMKAPAFALSASPVQKKAAPASPSGGVIQRYAFIKDTPVQAEESDNEGMKTMATDDKVRNYESKQEFQDHSEGKLDYIGNLATTSKAGTWMRFEKTGMNILGENHTQVQLGDVTPRVGSKNFINEQFSSDDMSKSPNLKDAYDQANANEFKRFEVDGEKDKQQYGSESLYPKMGFGLNIALPYFNKTSNIDDLKSGPDGYVGKPVQRYLKIAWGFSKDNVTKVEGMQKAKEAVPTKLAALSKVHKKVEADLDPFITALVVDGYLGDELSKKENNKLFNPLFQFATAIVEAMVEMASTDKSSRLSDAERKALASGKKRKAEDNQKLFGDWRNFSFEDNIAAGAKKGVRYAGMGKSHMDYLINKGLVPAGGHTYDMVGKDINAFEKETERLKKKIPAKK